MKNPRTILAIGLSLTLGTVCVFGESKKELEVQAAIAGFREAPQTAEFFENAYGFAIFPTVGKGGIGIGGAYGKGRVYRDGEYVGDTSLTQITIGFQLGGQAYSQIIFFQDERAFDEFTSGEFEFGAQVSAVALTAGAQASAGSAGARAGKSTSSRSAHAGTDYHHGMVIFTVTKGGLMYEASVGGQKFKFHPKN